MGPCPPFMGWWHPPDRPLARDCHCSSNQNSVGFFFPVSAFRLPRKRPNHEEIVLTQRLIENAWTLAHDNNWPPNNNVTIFNIHVSVPRTGRNRYGLRFGHEIGQAESEAALTLFQQACSSCIARDTVTGGERQLFSVPRQFLESPSRRQVKSCLALAQRCLSVNATPFWQVGESVSDGEVIYSCESHHGRRLRRAFIIIVFVGETPTEGCFPNRHSISRHYAIFPRYPVHCTAHSIPLHRGAKRQTHAAPTTQQHDSGLWTLDIPTGFRLPSNPAK